MWPLVTQSRRAIVSFGMSSEVLGNKRRARTPDVPNAPDPQSENTSDELDGAIDYEIERVCAFFSDFYASFRIPVCELTLS